MACDFQIDVCIIDNSYYCYYNNSQLLRMSEEKIDHQEDLKSASRRSRKDEQGRDYVCGCGKRYLSYPALYTHIKTKHDGHQPEGTQKTGVAPVNRRPKQKVDDKVLKDAQNLVRLENLNILNHLDENAIGSIPINNRIRKQILSKELIDVYQNVIKMPQVLLQKQTSLDVVLICYLIGVGNHVSEELLQYYSHFARLFRSCFIQYGQEVYDYAFKSEDHRKDRIINLNQCKMAPIIADFFLRFYVPFERKDADFLSAMEYICLDFCQWMFEHKLTIVEISLRKNQHPLRRNLIGPKQKDKKSEEQKQGEDEKEENEENHQSSMNESESEKEQEKQIQNEKGLEEEQPAIDQMEQIDRIEPVAEEQNNDVGEENQSPALQA